MQISGHLYINRIGTYTLLLHTLNTRAEYYVVDRIDL